jgi:N-sulfoglucosamine sulfohydrolase
MKQRKITTYTTYFSLLAILFIGCTANLEQSGTMEKSSEGPLNVLLITADDLNYNSVGVYGCPIPNITPHIDQLASEGLRFTHAYVNIAICQPSRQSILTGRYPHRNGAPGFEPIDQDVPTLPEELHKVGYLNAIIGKEEHYKPVDKFYWDYLIREEDVADGLGIGRDSAKYYQYTAEFLARAKARDMPFFLNANAHDPHRPFAGSEQEMQQWGEDLPSVTRTIMPQDVIVPVFLPDLPEVRKEMAEYYTSVYRCDQVVGAVLQALEDSGLNDNTLVVFMSDNGVSLPFGKGNCYLNSNKTPWIMRWPGQLSPGTVDSTHFISGIDFMPTVLHALHLSKTTGMDGYSFLPLLQGRKQPGRNKVFTQLHRLFSGREYPMRAVQEGRYGYIVNFWADDKFTFTGDALSGRTYPAMREAADTVEQIKDRVELLRYRVKEELYDFKNDPDALTNLIDDPEFAGERQQLKELLYREMKRSDDPLQVEFASKFLD